MIEHGIFFINDWLDSIHYQYRIVKSCVPFEKEK
jgi:hypothetical protein